MLHTVRLIEAGKAVPTPQDDAAATPAPKIFKEDCKITWDRPGRDIHNFIRGLSPKPCAFTFHEKTVLKMYKSQLLVEAPHGAPGEILRADDRLIAATADGAIEILELQQEGKRKLSSAEFLRGYRLTPGDTFTAGEDTGSHA